ncbi:MAG: hypothetical protein Q4G04_00965 [bacterium]|nr:hypothetical protein [bacterium]
MYDSKKDIEVANFTYFVNSMLEILSNIDMDNIEVLLESNDPSVKEFAEQMRGSITNYDKFISDLKNSNYDNSNIKRIGKQVDAFLKKLENELNVYYENINQLGTGISKKNKEYIRDLLDSTIYKIDDAKQSIYQIKAEVNSETSLSDDAPVNMDGQMLSQSEADKLLVELGDFNKAFKLLHESSTKGEDSSMLEITPDERKWYSNINQVCCKELNFTKDSIYEEFLDFYNRVESVKDGKENINKAEVESVLDWLHSIMDFMSAYGKLSFGDEVVNPTANLVENILSYQLKSVDEKDLSKVTVSQAIANYANSEKSTDEEKAAIEKINYVSLLDDVVKNQFSLTSKKFKEDKKISELTIIDFPLPSEDMKWIIFDYLKDVENVVTIENVIKEFNEIQFVTENNKISINSREEAEKFVKWQEKFEKLTNDHFYLPDVKIGTRIKTPQNNFSEVLSSLPSYLWNGAKKCGYKLRFRNFSKNIEEKEKNSHFQSNESASFSSEKPKDDKIIDKKVKQVLKSKKPKKLTTVAKAIKAGVLHLLGNSKGRKSSNDSQSKSERRGR